MTQETPGGKSPPLTSKDLVIHYQALPPRPPVLFTLWLVMADSVWPGYTGILLAVGVLAWFFFMSRAASIHLIDIFATWRKKDEK